MASETVSILYLFLLAVFLGYELVSKVPVVLHTPLMSGTNFIHGIIFIGSVAVTVEASTTLTFALGILSVFFSTLNVVGGFAVTDRMLEMFKPVKKEKK
jgi:NAD(P) transhydrogenase subunit alpha